MSCRILTKSMQLLKLKSSYKIVHCQTEFNVLSPLFGNTPACLSGIASNLDPSQIVNYEDIKSLPNHPEKLLIDVREPDELEKHGIIPTSINIPLKTIEENLKLSAEEFEKKFVRKQPSKETEVIFHCMGGGRAGRAAELALSLGFPNAKSYKGSWRDWSQREGLSE